LPALVLAGSTYQALRGPNAYCSNMKLAVSVIPVTGYGANPQYDPQYFATLTSEYVADDLTELLKSNPFAQYVTAELGYSLDPALIVAATRARKTHRTIDVSVCGSNREVIDEVGEAYARVVNRRLPEYFTQLQMQNAVVRIVNGPSVGRASSIGSLIAELGLRTRGRRELERTLDLPILAEIPAHGATLVR
jgi:hypothetical protein